MKIWAATALALATGVAASAALAEVDQGTVDSVKALWQQQHKSLDEHDIAAVMATYSSADDIMLMGTGPGEHWVGPEEIKDAYAHFMKGFDANTMEVTCGDGAGSTQGDVVWLTAVCNFSDSQAGAERKFVTNLSAVLVKEDDDWRFHTMHFSHLTGDDPADAKIEVE
jgi:ketosteroid isomerase-like protein